MTVYLLKHQVYLDRLLFPPTRWSAVTREVITPILTTDQTDHI